MISEFWGLIFAFDVCSYKLKTSQVKDDYTFPWIKIQSLPYEQQPFQIFSKVTFWLNIVKFGNSK